MLYKIEHLIYPIDLYIHIGEDITETLSQFIDIDTNLICNDNWLKQDAVVYRNIMLKDSKRYALLMAFEHIPNGKLIVHELTHLVHRLYEHISQTNFGDENNAYLMEYLFDEVEIAITKYKELNKE